MVIPVLNKFFFFSVGSRTFTNVLIDNERISPKKHFLFNKENLFVLCHSPTPAIWYFHRSTKNDSFGGSYKTKSIALYIKQVSVDDEGYYECQGTTTENLLFAAKMEVKIMCKGNTLLKILPQFFLQKSCVREIGGPYILLGSECVCIFNTFFFKCKLV